MTQRIQEAIQCGTLVRAERERVYDGIATADGLNAWFTNGAMVDARPGGEIWFRWKEWGVDRVTAEDRGRVVEARRPDRFVFEWHPDKPTYSTRVEIDFESREGGTAIHLRESGFHDTESGRRALLNCATGWGEALTVWKFFVEHGIRY